MAVHAISTDFSEHTILYLKLCWCIQSLLKCLKFNSELLFLCQYSVAHLSMYFLSNYNSKHSVTKVKILAFVLFYARQAFGMNLFKRLYFSFNHLSSKCQTCHLNLCHATHVTCHKQVNGATSINSIKVKSNMLLYTYRYIHIYTVHEEEAVHSLFIQM